MICVSNIIWLCVTVVAILLAIEFTRHQVRRNMHKECERIVCNNDQRSINQTQQNTLIGSPMPPAQMIVPPPPQRPLGPLVPSSLAVPPGVVAAQRDLASQLFPSPNNFPIGFPINQITHGPVDEWHRIGYVYPKKGTECGEAKRFPLYARRNLYQSYGFDYFVVDGSRNRVRINIELPRGVFELQQNDEINITGETCKFVVNIDIPADQSWQSFIPSPGFVRSWF